MLRRIRIEAVADTPEQAKFEVDTAFAHLAAACYLEGISASASDTTDEAYVRIRDEGPDQGRFEGRRVVQFDVPLEEPWGGLKLYGYRVQNIGPEPSPGTVPSSPVEPHPPVDVTDKVIVLDRRNPVTREHEWENGTENGNWAVSWGPVAFPIGTAGSAIPTVTTIMPPENTC